MTSLSSLLPKQLLVDILAERFQVGCCILMAYCVTRCYCNLSLNNEFFLPTVFLFIIVKLMSITMHLLMFLISFHQHCWSCQSSDCHRGVVIDGLESVYTQCTSSTLEIVLKAFNNRKHIYIVNLFDSYAALKEAEGKTCTSTCSFLFQVCVH